MKPIIFSIATVALLLTSTLAYSSDIEGPEGITYRFADRTLTTIGPDSSETIDLPCDGPAILHEKTIYLACGRRGVMLITVKDPARPTPMTVLNIGEVDELSLIRDVVWVGFADGRLEPLPDVDIDEPVAPPPSAGEPPAEEPEDEVAVEKESDADPEPAFGRVVTVFSGEAIIDIGTNASLERGSRVEFFEERRGIFDHPREVSMGIGEVLTAYEDRAVVRLPLNMQTDEAMIARKTEEKPRTWLATQRPREIFVTQVALRPFVPVGALGVGALADASIGYRFRAPLALDLVIDPAGFTITNAPDALAIGAGLLFSYASDVFQVGIGPRVGRFVKGGSFVESDTRPDAMGFGPGLLQYARLGSTEGLHLAAQTSFVVDGLAWQFGGINITGQIPTYPIRPNTWLILRGGGSQMHAYFETGLRLLTRGNGAENSIFLLPTVGVGHLSSAHYEVCEFGFRPGEVDQAFCRVSVSYTGPMAGIGVEWRR